MNAEELATDLQGLTTSMVQHGDARLEVAAKRLDARAARFEMTARGHADENERAKWKIVANALRMAASVVRGMKETQ